MLVKSGDGFSSLDKTEEIEVVGRKGDDQGLERIRGTSPMDRVASHLLLISYKMSSRHTMRRGTRRREALRSLEATRPGDGHEGFPGAPHCSHIERYCALPSYTTTP